MFAPPTDPTEPTEPRPEPSPEPTYYGSPPAKDWLPAFF